MSSSEKDGSDSSSPERDLNGQQQAHEKHDNMDQLKPEQAERRSSIVEGQVKHTKLGWFRLTICLIVEAIALGEPAIAVTIRQWRC